MTIDTKALRGLLNIGPSGDLVVTLMKELLTAYEERDRLKAELKQYTKQDGDVTWTSEILKDAPEGEVSNLLKGGE